MIFFKVTYSNVFRLIIALDSFFLNFVLTALRKEPMSPVQQLYFTCQNIIPALVDVVRHSQLFFS